ncbi:MAG: PaaI family thioesterase [Lachnospiraceae bacterium]
MTEEEMRGILDRNPFARYLGMKLIKVEEGFASGSVPMREEHNNVYGGMHGGCVFALADTIAGIAAATYGHMVTTLDSNFNYLEAIRDTKEVVCEAKVVRHGGRITVLDVEIYDDKKRLVCSGGFTYYNILKQSSSMYGLKNKNDSQ